MFGFGHHGAGLVGNFLSLFWGLADPAFFLFKLILNGILKILIPESLFSRLLNNFWFLLQDGYFFDLSIFFLVLDDLRVILDLLDLSMMHCCFCYKDQNKDNQSSYIDIRLCKMDSVKATSKSIKLSVGEGGLSWKCNFHFSKYWTRLVWSGLKMCCLGLWWRELWSAETGIVLEKNIVLHLEDTYAVFLSLSGGLESIFSTYSNKK